MKKIALLMLLITAACAPQLETQYEIVPPLSDAGRYCANGCLNGKSQCEQSCFDQQNSCEQMASFETGFAFGYGGGFVHRDWPADDSPRRQCSADECLQRCTQNYTVCHTNCGGKVIEHQVCTAFCGQ